MSRGYSVRVAQLVAVMLLSLAVVVWLCGMPRLAEAGGGCRGEPVTTADTTAVQIGEAPCFNPTIIFVRPGETVTWRNEGSLPHTVTGANASWGDYSELLNGQVTSQRFDTAGMYPYYCLLHPGMVGAVAVTDGPGTSGQESASLAGAGVAGALVAEPAAAVGSGGFDNLPVAVTVVSVVAAVVVASSGGFALGRRRRS